MAEIRKRDLRAERDRIAQDLHEQLVSKVTESGYMLGTGGVPSQLMLDAIDVKSLTLSASDAAVILELCEWLDYLDAKFREADQAYLQEYGRTAAAESAYRNPRVKGTEAKAVAAARALGLTAKDPLYWSRKYEEYVSFACYGKMDSIQFIADREQRTWGAVYQGLKREIARRRVAGIRVPLSLPRIT